MNKKEPTLGEILNNATERLNEKSRETRERLNRGDPDDYAQPRKNDLGVSEYAPPHIRTREKEYNTTWLQDMAKCLLDARYEEMMLFSEGIGADPAKVHQWAKTYVGDT